MAMTEAQRILTALRAADSAAAAPGPPPCLPALPPSTIASVKAFLGPGHPPSAWLGEPRAFTLGATAVHLRCGQAAALHTDTCPRLPFEATTFLPCGSDLPHAPAVLVGVAAGWRAMEGEGWSLSALAARCSAEAAFSLDGGPGFARESLAAGAVPMAAFLEYAQGGEAARDAAPLYIFDEGLRERRFASGEPMASEFSIPACFSADVIAAAAASRPLPPSWLLVGPSGSGTPMHNHPFSVGWCTLLRGVKLWVLLPPGAPPEALCVGEHNVHSEEEDLSALAWMLLWGGGAQLPPGAVTVLQRPGETVFLPAGWWHCVLNVQDSTALSHSLYLARDAGLRQAAGEG